MSDVPAQFSIQPNAEVVFKVRYEDEHVIVLDKPAHMVTQPGLGHDDDTLLNGVFARYGNKLQRLGKARDFGLLHRLDKETSGLLVIALTPEAYDALREAFESRSIAKFYYAVVQEPPAKPSGVVRRPIVEHAGEDASGVDRKKMARIGSGGKPALTAYRVLATSVGGALIECRPVTGRLHQVRIHLSSIGSPILGDGIYAKKAIKQAATRLALHAHRLVFTHPTTGERVDVHSPMPKDMKNLLSRLRLELPPVEAG
ncbi:MAG: RluA family pseudouridine synthase [Planctomycetota bacterium]|nr:RluA family pseudouridine synthase [Planctomycetota bacterium]